MQCLRYELGPKEMLTKRKARLQTESCRDRERMRLDVILQELESQTAASARWDTRANDRLVWKEAIPVAS